MKAKHYRALDVSSLEENFDRNVMREEIKERFLNKTLDQLISYPHQYHTFINEAGGISLNSEEVINNVKYQANRPTIQTVIVEVAENGKIERFCLKYDQQWVNDVIPQRINEEINDFKIVNEEDTGTPTFFKSQGEARAEKWIQELSDVRDIVRSCVPENKVPNAIERLENELYKGTSSERKLESLYKTPLRNTTDDYLKSIFNAFKEDNFEEFNRLKQGLAGHYAELYPENQSNKDLGKS